MNSLKSFTEINQCRNFNCKFHEPGNVWCRLKYVHIGIEGKCVYCEEKEPKINIENSTSIDRKYINDKLIPAVVAVLKELSIKNMVEYFGPDLDGLAEFIKGKV